MNFIQAVLFYAFISSALFMCGIGLERLYIHSNGTAGLYPYLAKNAAVTFAAVTLLWVFNRYALKPAGASFLLPVFVISVLAALSFSVKHFFPNSRPSAESETVFGYGLVFFVLYESASYLEAAAAVLSSYLTLLVFSYVLCAVRQKIGWGDTDERKTAPTVLISLGVIVMVFSLMGAAWIFNL